MIPMGCIRRLLAFDEASGTFSDHLNHVFWDELVPASAAARIIPVGSVHSVHYELLSDLLYRP
jgi:hypothetical protein